MLQVRVSAMIKGLLLFYLQNAVLGGRLRDAGEIYIILEGENKEVVWPNG